MGTRLHAKRAHHLPLEAALQAAIAIAKRAEDKAGVSYRVVGNRVDVEGKGVKGHLAVDATHVEVDMELGLLLRPMKSVIERKMEDYFDRYFNSTPK